MQEQAHGKKQKRSPIPGAQQNINGGGPKQKQGGKGAKPQNRLCPRRWQAGEQQHLQHPSAVQGGNGKEVKESQQNRRS